MRINKKGLLILLFILSICNAQSQIYRTYVKNDTNVYYNLVKKIWFFSEGNYYPLTVVISPFGYWFASDIYLGHNTKRIDKRLEKWGFGWGYEGLDYRTPGSYRYDTLVADTVNSIFKNVMCINHTPELPLNFNEKTELINITDSSSYADLVKEFKYTYLLKSIDVSQDSCEIIRCIYPLNVYYPYKTSFAVVVLKIWPDKIEMISGSINTLNLLNIKSEKYGSVILKKRDYIRLTKRLKKTVFDTEIDCKVCNYQYYRDFDFIIEYINNETQNSYFLCENMYLEKKDKKQKEVMNYLLGLFYSIYHFNDVYFGIERRNK